MSWESTLEYYRLLNEGVKNTLWGHHSAEILLYSFDFDQIKELQSQWEWVKAWQILVEWAVKLEMAGAEILLIATNTMHKVFPEIEKALHIPLIHIADGTGEKIQKFGYRKVWLLGTRFTMDHDFYKGRLFEKYGLEIIVPSEEEKNRVHTIIYDELCLWEIRESSREEYVHIIENMKQCGAECVILGCTEIGLLINEQISPIPVFDTTAIHVEYALEKMLEK